MMLETTCVNRFLRRCKECIRDYSADNHPNNVDCPHYREMRLGTFAVEEKKEDGQIEYKFSNIRKERLEVNSNVTVD